jgi:hypothetical protein
MDHWIKEGFIIPYVGEVEPDMIESQSKMLNIPPAALSALRISTNAFQEG